MHVPPALANRTGGLALTSLTLIVFPFFEGMPGEAESLRPVFVMGKIHRS